LTTFEHIILNLDLYFYISSPNFSRQQALCAFRKYVSVAAYAEPAKLIEIAFDQSLFLGAGPATSA